MVAATTPSRAPPSDDAANDAQPSLTPPLIPYTAVTGLHCSELRQQKLNKYGINIKETDVFKSPKTPSAAKIEVSPACPKVKYWHFISLNFNFRLLGVFHNKLSLNKESMPCLRSTYLFDQKSVWHGPIKVCCLYALQSAIVRLATYSRAYFNRRVQEIAYARVQTKKNCRLNLIYVELLQKHVPK